MGGYRGDRIIRHLELTFVAEKPPPAYALEKVALMAADRLHSGLISRVTRPRSIPIDIRSEPAYPPIRDGNAPIGSLVLALRVRGST